MSRSKTVDIANLRKENARPRQGPSQHVIALLLLTLVGGIYLSGLLTLWLLKLQTRLHFTTYVDYWRALRLPSVQPFASKVQLAGWLGFGPTLLL